MPQTAFAPHSRSSGLLPAAAVGLAVLIATPWIAAILCAPSPSPTTRAADISTEALDTLDRLNLTRLPVAIVAMNEVSSTTFGWSGLGAVNLAENPDSIYLADLTDNELLTTESVTVHEYMHIAEKHLADSAAPWAGWYGRITSLYLLDQALAPYTPPLMLDSPVLFPHLEAAAECATVSFPSLPEHVSGYINYTGDCTLEQRAAARSVLEGQWPTPETVSTWTQKLKKDFPISTEEIPIPWVVIPTVAP